MGTYMISALIAAVMLFSLYVLSLKRYPAELSFYLPNQTAEYKPPSGPLDDLLFSVSLSLRSESSLGGICTFTLGGYTVDLRVQNAKVHLIIKVTSSNLVKLALTSKENLYEGWNDLTMSAVAPFKVTLDLNGTKIIGSVDGVKGSLVTFSKVLFGHLNFKGCLRDLYFNRQMVHESDLNLINVIKGCS